MSGALVEAHGLTKKFGDFTAVDAVDFAIQPGEVYGFLGPNGAGKSSTMRMIGANSPINAGTLRVFGLDPAEHGRQIRGRLGVVPQEDQLDGELRVEDNLFIYGRYFDLPKKTLLPRIDELLDFAQLTEKRKSKVEALSGGMKRRLTIARALINQPELVFLDEPTTGLDPQSRAALWEEVARLSRDDGVTVFLTTQYLEEADVLADRVGIIDHGRIVAEGTPTALKAEIGRPSLHAIPCNDSDRERIAGFLSDFGEPLSGTDDVAVRLRDGVTLADVFRAVDADGIAVDDIELRAPTLDDVFLAKTGRTLEGAAEETLEEAAEVAEHVDGNGTAP
jgi:ABC-type multidrug transport system ATPase subunit